MSALPPGFVRLIAALMGLHATMAVARVTSTLWLLQNGHSAFLVGVMLALVSLTPALLGAPAGAWADRFGLWRPLWTGSLLAGLGVLAALVWPSVPTLVLAALGTGAALALAAVAVQRDIALLAQAQGDGGVAPQALYSWAAMGPALSNTLSPVVAGLVIDHLGFRPAFAVALLLAPMGVWLLRAHRQRPWPQATHPAGLMPAWDLLRQRPVRALLVLNMVLAVAWDAHTFVVPVLGHERGFSASTIGLLLGAFAVGVAAVRLAIVRWGGAWSDKRGIRVALGVTAATLAVYPWLPGVLGMSAGSFVLGMALGSVQPTMLAALTHLTPPARHGQALGLRMLMTNGAAIGMPVVFGAVVGLAGAAAPMGLMALVAALCWPATAPLDDGQAHERR
ncbi:MAG: MFS transporter [Inhella sp.]|uniref:MFS transporter n=1 Tax=Inhella sp. TaxID=1921806 RepID=UPI00391A453A